MNLAIDAARRLLLVTATTIADLAENTAVLAGRAAETLFAHGPQTETNEAPTTPERLPVPLPTWLCDPPDDGTDGPDCDHTEPGTWTMRLVQDLHPGDVVRIMRAPETVTEILHTHGDGYLGHVVHLHLYDPEDNWNHVSSYPAAHPLLTAVRVPNDVRDLDPSAGHGRLGPVGESS